MDGDLDVFCRLNLWLGQFNVVSPVYSCFIILFKSEQLEVVEITK